MNNNISSQRDVASHINDKNAKEIKSYVQQSISDLKEKLNSEINNVKNVNDETILIKLQKQLEDSISQLKDNLEKNIPTLLQQKINEHMKTTHPLENKPNIKTPNNMINADSVNSNPRQSVNHGPNVNPKQSVNHGPNVNPRQSVNPGPNVNPKQSVNPGPNVNPRQSVNPGPNVNPRQSVNADQNINNIPNQNNNRKPEIKISDSMVSNNSVYSKVLELKQKLSLQKNIKPSIEEKPNIPNSSNTQELKQKLDLGLPTTNETNNKMPINDIPCHTNPKIPIKITDDMIHNEESFSKVLKLKQNLISQKNSVNNEPSKQISETLVPSVIVNTFSEIPSNSNNIPTTDTDTQMSDTQWTNISKKKKKKKNN
jgi:hypothetical protein